MNNKFKVHIFDNAFQAARLIKSFNLIPAEEETVMYRILQEKKVNRQYMYKPSFLVM